MYKLDRERLILLASILHFINIRFTPLHLQRCSFKHQVSPVVHEYHPNVTLYTIRKKSLLLT